MPESLQQIVERMVAAGESEQDIAAVIQHYKPPTTEQPQSVHPHARVGNFIKNAVVNNPGMAGAMTASLAAIPFTAGLSVPAAMAAEAGLGAVGSLAGRGLKKATVGDDTPLSGMIAEAGLQGAFGAAGPPLGAALRFVGNKMRGFKAANAGGTLVPKQATRSVEEEMADVLAEARRPALPESVSLPPPQGQPRVSYPRETPSAAQPPAAAPKPTPARIVRAAPRQAAQPPNTNPVAAISEALTELRGATPAAPARIRSAPKPAPAVEELPASWQQFAGEIPKSAPKANLAPRTTETPLGLSDDAPMWGSPPLADDVAGEWRRAIGAEDAGARLGMSADDVRAAAGGPSRRPMVAELAEMDRNYLRRINDPRGEIDPKLLFNVAKQIGLPTIGGLAGPLGIAGGIIAANPKPTGAALYQLGRMAPSGAPNLARLALLELMRSESGDIR